MPARYPLPQLWMLTDERQGEMLWPALYGLRAGSGVIVRHYSLGEAERRQLFEKIKRIARRRRLVLVLADCPMRARLWHADGAYGQFTAKSRSSFLRIAPVHDLREIRLAEKCGARLLMLSPLFPTRSHPDGRALGTVRFSAIARQTTLPVLALGGLKHCHQKFLRNIGAYGWAAIDAHIRTEGARPIRT